MIECSFLIPSHRDAEISDGRCHSKKTWLWLEHTLVDQFGALTWALGEYRGIWRSRKTDILIEDSSRKFTLALPRARLSELRATLRVACLLFKQQCVYLSVAGHVEFVEPEDDQ